MQEEVFQKSHFYQQKKMTAMTVIRMRRKSVMDNEQYHYFIIHIPVINFAIWHPSLIT